MLEYLYIERGLLETAFYRSLHKINTRNLFTFMFGHGEEYLLNVHEKLLRDVRKFLPVARTIIENGSKSRTHQFISRIKRAMKTNTLLN